jgi:monovalent cation/proton antiporter MnhG/PhaG subunit
VSPSHLAVDVLLALGVTLELLCVLGVLVMRDALDRLHYAGAASTLGPLLIVAAILVEHPHDSSGVTAILVGAALLVLNPLLSTATARAARMRRLGRVEALPEERT